MSRDNIRIGNNHLVCNGVEKKEYKAGSNIITIKTLSPVTCYDSSERNGKNFTKYFTPNDDDFQRGIYFNLLRKYKLLNPGKDIPSDSFTVKPIGHVKERVSMFEKGGLFPVKGWWGRFKLEGSREILQTASAWIYFGGIGARTRRGGGTLLCDETPASLDEIVKSAKITLWRKKANDPMSAWSYAVSKYRDYRQKRNPGQGSRPGRSHWPEADSLRKITGRSDYMHKTPITSPLPSFPRAALGMPIIFHFKDRDDPRDATITPDMKDSNRMASPVITKALCDNGTWYSAVIILPHDDVLDVPLKLDGVNKDYSIPSRKGTSYPPMMGKLDAVSGFEEFISGDFKREAAR